MIAVMRRWLFSVALLIVANISYLTAQDVAVLDENVRPLYFESMTYPLSARFKHVQGAVVVRVTLDSDGKVKAASAVSGARSLLPDCLLNAKRWRFQYNSQQTAIIIYQFWIEGLCNLPCPSQFTFRPPNVATIRIGQPVVDHSAESDR